MKYTPFFILMILLTGACKSDTKSIQKVKITSLHPYSYTFQSLQDADSVKSLNKIYFFSANLSNQPDEDQKKQLYDLVISEKKKIKGHYRLLSIYIYKINKELNENYKSDQNSLLSAHKADRTAYVRWENDKMDIFYILENGNVVYDILEKKEISPPYEFD